MKLQKKSLPACRIVLSKQRIGNKKECQSKANIEAQIGADSAIPRRLYRGEPKYGNFVDRYVNRK